MLSSKEIRDIISDIRQTKRNVPLDTTAEIFYKNKYPKFAEDLPKLFVAALKDDFKMTYLDLMLSQYDKLCDKTIDVNTADECVIGKLRKDYVDPIVESLEQKGEQVHT